MEGTAPWCRAVLRHRAGSLLALGLVVGLGLGFTIVCLAGARRADTAYSRLRTATRAPDAIVDGEVTDEATTTLANLPGVVAISRFNYAPVAPEPLVPGRDGGAFVGLDDGFGSTVYRPLVVEGRLASPDRADEVVVNEAMAEAGGFEPGQRVTLTAGFEEVVPAGEATVVGVVRGIFDVGAASGTATMILPRSFVDARPEVEVPPIGAAMVRLEDGKAGLGPFTERASEALGDTFSIFSAEQEATAVERTLDVQVVALRALAGVAGVAVLLAAVQAAARVLDGPLAELDVLVGLGLTPRRRRLLVPVLLIPLGLVAAVVAAVVALLGSPRIPTGFARSVDPRHGIALDLTATGVVLGGWLAVLLVAGALLPADRRRGHRAPRPLGLLQGLPLRARLGSTAALTSVRGTAGAAARSALLAAGAATAGVIAVATFGASLNHLIDDVRLQGWDFDAVISSPGASVEDTGAALSEHGDDPSVDQAGVAAVVGLPVDDTVMVEAYAFDPATDPVHPTLSEGRAPAAADEIAMGRDLAEAGGLDVGDTVTINGPTGDAELRLVGIAAYPSVGDNGDLGNAASLTLPAARELGLPEQGTVTFVRLAEGAGDEALDAYRDVGEVVRPFEEARVQNLEEVGGVPHVLAAFLAVLGLAALLHALVRSVQGRRRDLAVLTALGMRRRDLRSLTGWQALTTVLVGGGLGAVVGVAIGRFTWSSTADSAAVIESVVVPVGTLVVIGVAVVLATLLLADVSSRLLVRGPTAHELRAD